MPEGGSVHQNLRILHGARLGDYAVPKLLNHPSNHHSDESVVLDH
jgi:hypothetical protein